MSEPGDVSGPKTLVLDLETSPNIVAVFQLKNQNIGLPQIIAPSRVTCFVAQWHEQPDTQVFHRGDTPASSKRMLRAALALLDEADAVAHYNGTRFDVPKLRGELAALELGPWAPFRHIDLWTTAKRFGYVSSKLDHVLDRLNLDRKLSNDGMALWLSCMGYGPMDREEAWALMEAYCRQDVAATDALLTRIRPWMDNLPHPGLYGDGEVSEHMCQRCTSSSALQRRGYYYTQLGRYVKYQCKQCRSYSRAKRADGFVGIRAVSS